MTYSAYDTSVQNGAPLELYKFVVGPRTYLYANGDESVEYFFETYRPQTIIRAGLEHTQEFGKSSIEVTLPRDSSIAIEFNSGVPDDVVLLTIFRKHYLDNDSQWVSYWMGRVVAPRFSGHELILKCEPSFTALRRQGLRLVYQTTCPHALYDAKCMAVKFDFRVDGTVYQIDGNTISCAAIASKPDGYFSGGFVIIDGRRRMVVNHVGPQAELLYPYPGLSVGAVAAFYAGCDRSLDTCNLKFSNSINFGGYPWMPVKNPFSGDAII